MVENMNTNILAVDIKHCDIYDCRLVLGRKDNRRPCMIEDFTAIRTKVKISKHITILNIPEIKKYWI